MGTMAQWKRNYAQFKRSIQVLAKLGTLDVMCQQVIASTPADNWEKPDWAAQQWQDTLYNDIVAGQASPMIIGGLIRSIRWGWWAQPRPDAKTTLQALDALYRQFGKQLRERFGVYGDVPQVPKADSIQGVGEPATRRGRVSKASVRDVRPAVRHP